MSTYRPRLYTASKLIHADMWRDLRLKYSHIEFSSRWLDMDHLENGCEPTAEDFERFWLIDIHDVRTSDMLLIYSAHEQETLRGALVEAGAAIATGIPVLSVGHRHILGTWQDHPLVKPQQSVQSALKFVEKFCLPLRG